MALYGYGNSFGSRKAKGDGIEFDFGERAVLSQEEKARSIRFVLQSKKVTAQFYDTTKNPQGKSLRVFHVIIQLFAELFSRRIGGVEKFMRLMGVGFTQVIRVNG